MTLFVSPSTQSFSVGETRDYQIMLDSTPRGLAGYDMIVSLSDPGVAIITGATYPSWAQMPVPLHLPNSSITLRAVDTNQVVIPGSTNILLATITLSGVSDGTTRLTLAPGEMSADNGRLPVVPTAINNGTAVVGRYAGPVAAFSANPTSGPAQLTVQFTDQSTGSPTSWNWSFSDGNFSTLQHPAHTYAYAGSFTVSLNATTIHGWNVTAKSGYITGTAASSNAPVIAFTSNVTTGTVPLAVKFTDISSGDPTSWAWDINNDGTIDSTSRNPSYTYTNVGTYSVTLTAANAAGQASATKTNYISATPIIIPTTTIPTPTPIIPTDTGSITVTSTPAGARIFINGANTGEDTPHTFSGKVVGSYMVSVNLAGYTTPATQTKAVTKDTETLFAFQLSQSPTGTGSIMVTSIPASAEIFINGADTGFKTPHLFEDMAVGSYAVYVTKDGYITPATQTKAVKDKKTYYWWTHFGRTYFNFILKQDPRTVSIKITSPNGGETWQRGETYPITWSYPGTTESDVSIVLLKGNTPVYTIAKSVSLRNGQSGSYTWEIPSDKPLGSDYKVVIQSTNQPAIKDMSDNSFSIIQNSDERREWDYRNSFRWRWFSWTGRPWYHHF